MLWNVRYVNMRKTIIFAVLILLIGGGLLTNWIITQQRCETVATQAVESLNAASSDFDVIQDIEINEVESKIEDMSNSEQRDVLTRELNLIRLKDTIKQEVNELYTDAFGMEVITPGLSADDVKKLDSEIEYLRSQGEIEFADVAYNLSNDARLYFEAEELINSMYYDGEKRGTMSDEATIESYNKSMEIVGRIAREGLRDQQQIRYQKVAEDIQEKELQRQQGLI